MIKAEVIADSVSPEEVQLTTVQYRAPRCILAEINTHRVFSRSARSSRAVPTTKLLAEVENDPFIPMEWGKNQPGMQAREVLSPDNAKLARLEWLRARDSALSHAREMAATGVHKQVVNRIIEPWMWVDGVITATEWENFFELRCHPDAEPHMRALAEAIRTARAGNTPAAVAYGQWHLPYITRADGHTEGIGPLELACVSAARCARVSYAPHDGAAVPNLKADLDRACAMWRARPVHASPFEHAATPESACPRGNLHGWNQLRHWKRRGDE